MVDSRRREGPDRPSAQEEPANRMTIAMPRMTRLPIDQRGITLADFLVPIQVGERLGVRVRNIALIVAGALLIYLTARIVFPVPGSPDPRHRPDIRRAARRRRARLPARACRASCSTSCIGLIGLPWFAEGKGGVNVILGARGRLPRRIRHRGGARRAPRGARLGPADPRCGRRDADRQRRRSTSSACRGSWSSRTSTCRPGSPRA